MGIENVVHTVRPAIPDHFSVDALSFEKILRKLYPEEVGFVFRAILAYSLRGEEPVFTGLEDMMGEPLNARLMQTAFDLLIDHIAGSLCEEETETGSNP